MSDTIHIDSQQSDTLTSDQVTKIQTSIIEGNIVICPTESSYLIGGNGLDPQVVARIYHLKKRSRDKPLPLIIGSTAQAERYAYFTSSARRLGRQFWPGPLTLVLRARPIIPPIITADTGLIGMRVSGFPLLQRLMDGLEVPLISTSANISGNQEPYDPQSFYTTELANHPSISYIIDAGPLPHRKPSTIVDVSTDAYRIIREGAIPSSTISTALSD